MAQLPSNVEPFADSDMTPAVRGFLHRPPEASGAGIVLTHSGGSNCEAPLLVAVAEVFARAGFTVLRCDLPFRQWRPHGPPRPGSGVEDREGLRRALGALKKIVPGRLFLGGHSYGGRQATMLVAADPALTDGLLAFSYPLHPPRRASQLRTNHFPKLRTRTLFVHGSRDPFGSPQEIEAALKLIPVETSLIIIEGASHDLAPHKENPLNQTDLAGTVLTAFTHFFPEVSRHGPRGATRDEMQSSFKRLRGEST